MSDVTWTPTTIPLRALTPWERNPKRISKTHAARLLDLWERLGQFQTIAIGPAGEVYDGHQRLSVLKAAHGAGYEVQALQSLRALTEGEREELTIAAHVGTVGQFDWDALSGWDAGDLQQWGFDTETLTNWQTDIGALRTMLDAEQAPQGDDPGAQIDKAAELQAKWSTSLGQLWALGEHRLIVGDCTDAAVVARVMGGEKAALCLTDPPYATGGKSSDYDIQPDELLRLIERFLPLAKQVSERVLLTPGNAYQFMYPKPTWVLAWFVQAGVGVNPWGFTFWNAIFAYGSDPYLARGLGSRPDAFVKTEPAEKVDHPTSKPIEVWSWILERGSVAKNDLVYDPFLGSGTTLIACERLGRRCRACEIEPGYVAVCLERWATMTGKTPVLLGNDNGK